MIYFSNERNKETSLTLKNYTHLRFRLSVLLCSLYVGINYYVTKLSFVVSTWPSRVLINEVFFAGQELYLAMCSLANTMTAKARPSMSSMKAPYIWLRVGDKVLPLELTLAPSSCTCRSRR